MLIRKNKTSTTEIILDILQRGAETATDLFTTMTSSYSESYRRARRGMLGEPAQRFKKSWSELYRNKKSFYSLLQKLKRGGLVANEGAGRGKSQLWRITGKGKGEFTRRKEELEEIKWLNQRQKSSVVIIVSYDIPEAQRRERAWIREVLKLFNFIMIQKSVWVGTTILPKEFIREISRKKLVGYVEIFEVSKLGTISKVGDKSAQ